MRLLPLLASRALLRRPARSVLAASGVALGVATVVSLLVLDASTIASERARRAPDYGEVDLEARPIDAGGDARARLRATPGVGDLAAVAFGPVVASIEGRSLGALTLVALDPGAGDSFRAYRVVEGEDLDEARPSGGAPPVLLSRTFAAEARAPAGSRIEIRRAPEAARRGCFEGELRVLETPSGPADASSKTFRVAGLLAPERMGRYGGGRVALVSYDDGLRLLEGGQVAPVYWIRKRPGVPLDTLRASLREGFTVSGDRSVLVGEDADERAFRNGVRLSGVLALALGLFVIFHTLATALVERLRTLACLHALGATRGQIARSFLLEAAAIAATGSVAGVALGLLLARALLAAGVTTLGLGREVTAFEVPWGAVAGIGLLGGVVAVAGAIYPLARARAIPTTRVLAARDLARATDVFGGMNRFAIVVFAGALPVLYFALTPLLSEARGKTTAVFAQALALFGVGLGIVLFAPRLLALPCRRMAAAAAKRFPLEGLLAGRTLSESTARVASSVAALALVGASLLALKGMTAGLRGEIEAWAREAVEEKVFFDAQPAVPYVRLRAIARSIEGIDGLEPATARVYAPFLVRAVRAEDLAAYGPFRDDPEAARRFVEGPGIVVSRRLATWNRLREGDSIPLGTDAGPRFARVSEVSDAYGFFPDERAFAAIDEGTMKRFYCLENESVDRFSIHLRPGAGADLVASRVVEAIGPAHAVRARTGISVRDFQLEDLTRDFTLFDIVLGLVAALAGLGLLNALLIAGLERSKEIGVLRALGMTASQLGRSVSIEAAATGLLGGAAALLLGLPFAWIVVEGLRSISGLDLPHRFPPLWIGATFVGCVALSLLAALFPIARLRRLPVVEAIRYE